MTLTEPLFCGPLPKISRTKNDTRNAVISSSLDHQETNLHKAPVDPWKPGEQAKYRDVVPPGYIDCFVLPTPSPEETAFRHSGWADTRCKIRAAMERVNSPAPRRERFAACGGGAWVYANADGSQAQIRACYCHDRLCTPCGSEKARRIVTALGAQLAGRDCRFITLTLRANALPLFDQLTRLYRCFTNLRRHRLWREHVRGGAAFCEIKRNMKTRGWHVHLHCLVEGDYLAQRLLSSAWLVATGDSPIVDIRPIAQSDGAAKYVTKYVTKPIDSAVVNDADSLCESILALKGRRLCMTFGSWRGVELEPARPLDENDWKMIGRLDGIIRAAKAGQQAALGLLKLIRRNYELSDLNAATPDFTNGQPAG